MDSNGQEKQDNKIPQQETAQPERQEEKDSASTSVQIEQQLTAEKQKTEEYLDQLRRTQADFVNYRNRISQEQAQERITAQSTLLSHILPVLDDLGRALAAAPPELVTHPWVQGLFLVARRLTTQLDQLGIRQIGHPGEMFDPRQHEAIMTEERKDVPEGTILQVIQPGYVLGERIIRPAQVSVAVVHDASAQSNDSDEMKPRRGSPERK